MTGASLLPALILMALSPAPEAESARYLVTGPSPWKSVRPVEGPGYRVALSSRDGVTLIATVVVDGKPLPDTAVYPLPPSAYPAEARALLEKPLPPDSDADALSRMLVRRAGTQLEAIERVVAHVSRRVRYELPPREAETAAECLRRSWGSCVGRSLLAADLLIRAGIPARQVTGILTAGDAAELTESSRPAWREEISGVRHRWIEAYVPGLGWVPSDPGGLANTVTARHLALVAPPEQGFALTVLGRSPELKRPPVAGSGRALGRPRSLSRSAGPGPEATDLVQEQVRR